MNIKECIDIVDNIKPNQYTIRDKVSWLSFIDGIIINEVLKTHEGYDGRYDDFIGYSEDKLTVPLIVPSPYDRLYTEYLKMKIDSENGETARYNNSAALYNSYMNEFRKHYNRTHMPIGNTDEKKKTPPKNDSYGISEAEYENLKRDLTFILTEHFKDTISNDKVYDVVTEYAQNNMELLVDSVKDKISTTLFDLGENIEFTKKDVNSLNSEIDEFKKTIPDWTKQPTKPKYTANEVSLENGVPLNRELESINLHLNDNDNRISKKADTEYVNAALSNKVDKVNGKGLSSNDFTDAEKAKLAGFRDANYYASEASVESVKNVQATIVSDFDRQIWHLFEEVALKQNEDFIVTAEETFNENGYRILSDLSETFLNIKSAYEKGKNVYLKVYSEDAHGHYFIAPLTTIDDGVAGFKTIRDIRDVACIWSVNVISQQYGQDILMLGMQDLCSKYELEAKQNKETVLGEIVVDTPVWENQPTELAVYKDGVSQGSLTGFDMSGEWLGNVFNTSDFYYVTLKNANGNALPSGQFMLKHFYSDTAPIDANTAFCINGLNTGADTGVLTENTPVEFVAVGDKWLFRHAGVSSVSFELYKEFPETGGKISISMSGYFCPITSAGYFAPQFLTDKDIKFSDQNKTWGTESVLKYIRNHASFNAGTDFKTIRFRDEFSLTRNAGNFFSTERKIFVAKQKYNDSTDKGFASIVSTVSGLGEILYPGTKLKTAYATILALQNYGVLRNGTVIRLTEVK